MRHSVYCVGSVRPLRQEEMYEGTEETNRLFADWYEDYEEDDFVEVNGE